MPQVVASNGEVKISIEDDLYKDFFEEHYLYEKDLLTILAEYDIETRYNISRFIMERLAEVDPGYLPENSYG